MRVLILGPQTPISDWLERHEDLTSRISCPIDKDSAFQWKSFEFLVSHRYEHRVPDSVLNYFPQRAVNIHSGVLPQNKGVHPVFWAWLEDLPQGYTIHYMTRHIDAGPIIERGMVEFMSPQAETFYSSWTRIEEFAAKNFIKLWPDLKCGRVEAEAQDLVGTYHSMAAFNKVAPRVLTKGWETPVLEAKRRYDAIRS